MGKKQESFYVEARIVVSVGVEVVARSLEDAVEKSKSMKLDDFIGLLGDLNDSNHRISGVYLVSSLPAA